MLFAGKTTSGNRLWPRWWCFLFGGLFRQRGAGYGWTPSLRRRVRKYYREGWGKAGYTLREWVRLKA